MVQSRLNNEINYEEKKTIDKKDKGKSTTTYIIDIDALNTKALIGIGSDNTKHIEKSIIHFPIYLVLKSKDNSESGSSIFEKIGVFEIPSNELVNIVDNEGDLDLENLEDLSIKKEQELGYELIEPLLFSYITKEYITENNQDLESFIGDADEEAEDDDDEEESGEEPEEEHDDDEEIEEGIYEDDLVGDDSDESDSEEEEKEDLDDFSDLSSDSENEEITVKKGSDKSDDDDSDEDEDSDVESDDESEESEADSDESESDSDSESEPELDFNYIFDNWVTDFTKDTNFNIVDNEGGGDCFFAVIRDAYKSIDKNFSVKSLRELLSREATQEVFQNYKIMYKSLRETARDTLREMKKLKKKNAELQKQMTSEKDVKGKKPLTKSQKKKIVDEAKENKKEFDKLAKEKKETEEILVEYQFMRGIKTLCDFKAMIKKSDFWAETWTISTLERVLNTKFVILSSEQYNMGDRDNVLQCGQSNDDILKEKGEFTPDYYIVMDFTGGHYMLITHKDQHIFTYVSLPKPIKKLIVDKCLEGKESAGPYALIPEFKEYKK